MRRFEGKRVIITGGANGIGKATVARFAAEGATIVLTDIDRLAAEATAHRIRVGEDGRPGHPGQQCRHLLRGPL
jgi:NAD(P)-dependent dehydrogenase (short-subunit alcohol dehydrogenase family)